MHIEASTVALGLLTYVASWAVLLGSALGAVVGWDYACRHLRRWIYRLPLDEG